MFDITGDEENRLRMLAHQILQGGDDISADISIKIIKTLDNMKSRWDAEIAASAEEAK